MRVPTLRVGIWAYRRYYSKMSDKKPVKVAHKKPLADKICASGGNSKTKRWLTKHHQGSNFACCQT